MKNNITESLPGFIRECFDKEWSGESKNCNNCERDLPNHPIFFNGIDKCRECFSGTKFINTHTIRIFKHHIPEGMKYCSGCSKILPMNLDYFNKGTKGFHSKCKLCRGFKSYEQSVVGINQKLSKENKKMCKYCKEIKDISNFPRVRNTQVVNAGYCENCIPLEREKDKKDRVKFKGKKSEYDKKYYELNKEKRLKYRSKWKKTVHGQQVSVVLDKKRESKKRNLLRDFTQSQWLDALYYFNYECAYCGITQDEHKKLRGNYLSQEHVIPLCDDGVYSDFNIIPSCASCNSRKNKHDLEYFFEKYDYFTKERYIKVLDFFLSKI